MQLSNLNKQLLLRLIAAWVLLSLIIGIAVYHLEVAEADSYVLDLVLQDSETFDPAMLDRINDSDAVALFQDSVNSLLQRHYSLVDIYDLNQAHVATAERELASHLREVIEPRHHIFPLDKKLHFEKFAINDTLFLQVLVPLKNSKNKTVGYMEGVYQMEDEVLSGINKRIYRILFLVVVTLLASTLALYPIIVQLNRKLVKFSRNMLHANLQLMDVLGNAIAVRDETTNSHNYRVTLYAVRIGEALKLSHADMRSLIAGSFLHDVGKIGIRDAVLRKPQELTQEESEHMQEHVLLGMNVIGDISWLSGAKKVIEFHHEKYDGSGYRAGLKGEDIPMTARIFSVADVFDALTTQRSYKEAFTFEQAMESIKSECGLHFDPKIVEVFDRIAAEIYAEISNKDNKTLELILTVSIDSYFFDQQVF